ncbi:hypothetical protein ABMA27_000113 [Loxostege sticticalis]|uniref:Rho-GAP domain-containing protein n=1 Tax=Loxostege sticticalis TaxID=481309 RepID=A0ABR3IM66_LOXSC
MDTPPVPKPRSAFLAQNDPEKRPVPLPRTKVPANNDRVSATDILRSISSVSKQITEDVAQKVTNSAKSANEKIERSIQDGSKFAKGTLEKTLTTSKALRDSVTKSVIEGTRSAGVKLRRQKKPDSIDDDSQRCMSMPVVDVSLFDNIQFHSPLLEQKRFHTDVVLNNDVPSLHLNASHMDDLSLFSNNSDSNTDTVSDFSYDGRESEVNTSSLNLSEQMTYDTPRASRTNSIVSTMSTPEVPERRKKRESAMDIMRQNSLYENWTLPFSKPSPPSEPSTPVDIGRPSKSTIYEFDPLNTSSTAQRYAGVSNELILLESFLIGDTYGSIINSDTVDDGYDYRDSEYFNPPTPPERSDSLLTSEITPTVSTTKDKDNNSNWFDDESDTKSTTDEVKTSNSMMQKFSHMLKLDNVLHKSTKPVPQKVDVVERPPLNTMTVPYFCGTLTRIVSAMGEDLFKNSQSRYCVLSDQKLICYSDPTNAILKEAYTLDSVYSLQIGWRYMIRLAAFNNGAQIHHQQLTKDDVPTIVDKCISFIYAHGSLSEGIFRRAGSSTVLSELLARFRRDAWSVQLSPSQHSEHDVAGVLKRFFRDLPESLVPQDKHQALTSALEIKDDALRHAEYRRVMTSLPLVARNTARKLFAHLHFLTTMAHANKMGAENLASVWAPTVMPAALTSDTLQTAWSTKEVFVVRDLIANFEAIWEPTDAEKRREAAVRRVLMTVLGNVAPAPKKAAGDLRAWVYVKDRSTCHQVTLTPNKTCSDVCIELCEKANMESHQLMIEEVVCNGAMRRIVHIDEVVLDVVLRWGYWDEEDRKDNYLLVKENKILTEIEALRHSNSLVCGELKLATETMKSFKLHMFEVQNNKLCYFKDKQGSHKIEEWDVKDILWYTGHEPKRNPQSRWAITFIPRNNKKKRSKDRPWFGCTIAGAVTEDQLKWMAALMFGEHSDILPTPRLVIT